MANRFWVDGACAGEEPESREDRIVYRQLLIIEDSINLAGYEMELIEDRLRLVFQDAEKQLTQLIAKFYQEQARLIEEQDTALAAVTGLADNPAITPEVVAYLREAVKEFYRPQFEQVDISVKVLEHLQMMDPTGNGDTK